MLKNCVYLDCDMYSNLSAQVKQVDLKTLQVIVKSNWQHTS